MHRSGTSWLAGSLEELGLPLGEVSVADPHNLKGNRESPVLMDLHDAVLHDNDRSWKRPGVPNRWSGERSAALARHIAEMDAQHGRWGFKDPRALLLFDEWRRQVGDGLARVGIYRHPGAVHLSLANRNPRFDESRAAKLWAAYNDCLVAEHRRAPFPLLRFDVETELRTSALASVAAHLRLPQADRRSTFFDEGLVHNAEAAAAPVPRACRPAWMYLEEHAARGGA
jgi:hypothetical protein